MLHSKDPTLNNDRAHVQGNFLHGRDSALNGFTEEGRAFRLGLGLLRRRCRHRPGFDHTAAHFFHSLEQLRTFQRLSSLKHNMYRSGKAFLQLSLHRRCDFFQFPNTVAQQLDMQGLACPAPLGTCQGCSGRGCLLYKQISQFLRLHALQLMCRVGCDQFHGAQTIAVLQLFFNSRQRSPWNIGVAIQSDPNTLAGRVNIRSSNSRLRKSLVKLFRRRIVGEHIQKEYFLFHLKSSKQGNIIKDHPPGR